MSAAILVEAPRVHNGEPATKPMAVNYRDTGDGLPVLVILSNWQPRKGEYRDCDTYHVEEIPTGLGRGFLLHRDPFVVAKEGPEADDYYGVLVANDQDRTCSCRGFQAHGRCKHMDALTGLLAAGHIDNPLDRPDDGPGGVAPF